MTCPNIYLGPSLPQAPPSPFWQNTAIDTGASTDFTSGVLRIIAVTVRNNGSDVAPDSQLELFWSDPTTGFAAVSANLIGSHIFSAGNPVPDAIPGATTIPPADGEASNNFGWTPDSGVAGTNGGHVCLLARVENIQAPAGAGCMQQFFTTTPQTDPRSAIRNIHVYAPPPPPPMPGRGDGGAGGGKYEKEMNFAFAATNILPGIKDTKVIARVLHPDKDAAALQLLVSDRAVDRILSRRQLKFASPKDLVLAQGRERAAIPAPALARKSKLKGNKIPRLSRLGPMGAVQAKHFVRPGSKLVEANRPTALKLAAGEMQQAIVQIRPRDTANAAYAVAIEHHADDGRLIGGLTVVFVPPHRSF